MAKIRVLAMNSFSLARTASGEGRSFDAVAVEATDDDRWRV